MAIRGLDLGSLNFQTVPFSHTHNRANCLLSPNLFPPHCHLNFFKDLSRMLVISTSSSPFSPWPTAVQLPSWSCSHQGHLQLPCCPSLWSLSLTLPHLSANVGSPDDFHLPCDPLPLFCLCHYTSHILFYLFNPFFSTLCSWIYPPIPKY